MQPTPLHIPSWRWCVSLMNGARIKRLGFVRADDYEGAIHRPWRNSRWRSDNCAG